MIQTIADQRLRNHSLVPARHRTAAAVVEWLGAVQAQEYEPAKWGLGLRIAGDAVDASVERAFEEGRILRTHLMRPTWHFVTPADIRWMLELTGPRVQRVMAPYNRHLELDAATLTWEQAFTMPDEGHFYFHELKSAETGADLQRPPRVRTAS